MKFETLQELIDYVPRCLICNKEMQLDITGTIPFVTGYDFHSFKMILNSDGRLSSKNKSLDINPKTNEVFSGLDTLSKMVYNLTNHINIYKKCYTCSFLIKCKYDNIKYIKLEKFPTISLIQEELSYTMSKNKAVRYVKYFPPNFLGSSYMTINNKYINNFYIDLSKINNLKHLTRKIKTFLTFQ